MRPFTNKQFWIFSGLILSVTFAVPLFSYAQNIQLIKDKISERNIGIQNLEQEIKEYERQLSVLGRESTTLENAIQVLEVNKKKVSTDIQLTESNISKTNLVVSSLGLDIETKEELMKRRLDTLAETIRQIDTTDDITLVEIMLAHTNISDFFADVENLGKFQNSIKEDFEVLGKLKSSAEENKAQAEAERQKLLGFKTNLADQRSVLLANQREKDALLTVTKNKESSYQDLLDEKVAAKEAFEQELQDLESDLQIALDPSRLPDSGTKSLRYPIDGTIVLTQKFGKTADSGRLYASGTHNGIDFRAPLGTPIKAASSGRIIGAGDTDATCRWASYGKWVLIEHNNGLTTLYAHLSVIKVQEGQIVTVGDVIGFSGNSGYSTGPHLHFTVFASQGVKVGSLNSKSCVGSTYRIPLAPGNAYLDPEQYL